MIMEDARLATPTQRLLHARYQEIHRKFFPKPPAFPELIEEREPEPLPLEIEPVPPPIPLPPAQPVIGIEQTRQRMRIIRRIVCDHYCIRWDDLVVDRRTKEVVLPRHTYIYFVHRFTKASLPTIGRALGGQDHTTVLNAVRKMQRRIGVDREFADKIKRIENRVAFELGERSKPRHVTARYVEHRNVADYLLLGWMWAANLNEYAALLIWPCGCECVEPKT